MIKAIMVSVLIISLGCSVDEPLRYSNCVADSTLMRGESSAGWSQIHKDVHRRLRIPLASGQFSGSIKNVMAKISELSGVVVKIDSSVDVNADVGAVTRGDISPLWLIMEVCHNCRIDFDILCDRVIICARADASDLSNWGFGSHMCAFCSRLETTDIIVETILNDELMPAEVMMFARLVGIARLVRDQFGPNSRELQICLNALDACESSIKSGVGDRYRSAATLLLSKSEALHQRYDSQMRYLDAVIDNCAFPDLMVDLNVERKINPERIRNEEPAIWRR